MKAFIRILCWALAALLLVLSLFTEIRTNALRDEMRALQRESEALTEEIRVLDVRLAARLPFDELERLAKEELGMRPCRPDQRVALPSGES